MLYICIPEVCTGQIFQARARHEVRIQISATAWSGTKEKKNFGPREVKISARTRPGRKRNANFSLEHGLANFFPDFCPDLLGLSNFKSIQLLALNKSIFLLMIYFSAIYWNNRFDIDCFLLQLIKIKSHYRNTKYKIQNWTIFHSKLPLI